MPKLTSRRYCQKARSTGHDQTMGLAEKMREREAAIAAAKSAVKCQRLAQSRTRTEGPAKVHLKRDLGGAVLELATDRKERAAAVRARMLAALAAE